MNFKAWIHSVAAAAIGAVSAAITTSIASPSTFNLTPDGLKHLGAVCAVSALLAVAAVLKQSPLPADSVPSSKGVGQAALVAFMLGSLLMVTTTGCTQAQKVNVAQEIVIWTPVVVSAADTVAATVELLDPASAVALTPLSTAIDALAPQFTTAAQNYLANPGESTLAVVQSLIAQIQQNTNAALLAALKITDPATQAKVLRDINALATGVSAILALVQSISTKGQVSAMAAGVTVTYAQVRKLMDEKQLEAAAEKTTGDLGFELHVRPDAFFSREAQLGF